MRWDITQKLVGALGVALQFIALEAEDHRYKGETAKAEPMEKFCEEAWRLIDEAKTQTASVRDEM